MSAISRGVRSLSHERFREFQNFPLQVFRQLAQHLLYFFLIDSHRKLQTKNTTGSVVRKERETLNGSLLLFKALFN
jgi:hypothetical protein